MYKGDIFLSFMDVILNINPKFGAYEELVSVYSDLSSVEGF